MTIRWSGNLVMNVNGLDNHIRKGMVAAANYAAPRVESHMKQHAPWTDRTGNARSGLNATVSVGARDVKLVMAHGVSYGIWLEVRWGGKYAIIKPTMQVAVQWVGDALSRLIFT